MTWQGYAEYYGILTYITCNNTNSNITTNKPLIKNNNITVVVDLWHVRVYTYFCVIYDQHCWRVIGFGGGAGEGEEDGSSNDNTTNSKKHNVNTIIIK